MNDSAAPALLEEFVAELSRLCGARGVAVLVHLEPVEQSSLLLAHTGDYCVPELADRASAWGFLAPAQAQPGQSRPLPDLSLRRLDSADGEGVLLCLPLAQILPRAGEADEVGARRDERRAHPVVHSAPSLDGSLWIGIDGAAEVDRLVRILQGMDGSVTLRPEDESGLARFVTLSARLAWQVYHLSRSVRDPVSQLPGRMEFEVFLSRALAAAAGNTQPLGLLLINPDDFVMVNHRFGREQGDLVIREIALRLAACARQSDGVFRYGGAVFGVVLPATDFGSCRTVAAKFRRALAGSGYLEDELQLTFTIGGAVVDLDSLASQSLQPLDLVQRADNALNRAKLSGGERILLSAMSESSEGLNHFDPLSGIFTTDTEKDYRNMLLLWETVSLVSSTPDPQEIANSFVDRLGVRFRPDRLTLVRIETPGDYQVMASNVRDDSAADGRTSGRQFRLGDEHRALIEEALQSNRVERHNRGEAESPLASTSYAVPMTVGDKGVGCLLLDGVNRRLQLDSSDLIFLAALADSVSIALDRASLAANWIREKDRESRQLRQEVKALREVLNHSTMVYESPEMQAVMETAQRVAPSEATILIIGESGTGKEMLARAVHDMSHRSERAFVTVDCGAIAHTLLEAELFGHVKGAYTGAESASEGRIVQADGGTIFLDEIGELPLDLQTKLLRFVQEKEITPVGGNRTIKVDVRIVAATNRELQDEVGRGRFRQDLYYRLQVISLRAVPLRDRRADILPLARHFVETFSVQHGCVCRAIGEDAEAVLLQHHWPGNVRELQNCILRAVLLCEGDRLHAADIELHPESHGAERPAPAAEPTALPPSMGAAPAASVEAVPRLPSARPERSAGPPVAGAEDDGAAVADVWARLRQALVVQVDAALDDDDHRPLPVGRWLQEDLVLGANQATDGVARRAARLLGVPESTYRRQLDKASADVRTGLAARPPAWTPMAPVLEALLSSGSDGTTDLLERARQTLLEVVSERAGGRAPVGASLMGVTPPTYKRWLEDQAA